MAAPVSSERAGRLPAQEFGHRSMMRFDAIHARLDRLVVFRLQIGRQRHAVLDVVAAPKGLPGEIIVGDGKIAGEPRLRLLVDAPEGAGWRPRRGEGRFVRTRGPSMSDWPRQDGRRKECERGTKSGNETNPGELGIIQDYYACRARLLPRRRDRARICAPASLWRHRGDCRVRGVLRIASITRASAITVALPTPLS